ncbi:MAG: hypothetical protein JNL35_16685 [Sphingopyxis sp.]|nr:hypothetical protein [Sphingopyxis sp.]
MIAVGAWAAALMLPAASEPASVPPSESAAVTEQNFAPPGGQPMTYRVTTRRISRSGNLISFTLVYALEWQGAGRGYRLDAVLRRIESDARPELVRALTGLVQPLIGERIAYLVDADGRSVVLADPAQLWAQVAESTQAMAADAKAPEAQQVAALLAALPDAERDRLVTADIRALIAPASTEIPATGDGDASVSIRHDGAQLSIAKVEKGEVAAGGTAANPLDIEMLWTIDTTTGLVMREQRQSWIADPDSAARTLVEERVRALSPGDPG